MLYDIPGFIIIKVIVFVCCWIEMCDHKMLFLMLVMERSFIRK